MKHNFIPAQNSICPFPQPWQHKPVNGKEKQTTQSNRCQNKERKEGEKQRGSNANEENVLRAKRQNRIKIEKKSDKKNSSLLTAIVDRLASRTNSANSSWKV